MTTLPLAMELLYQAWQRCRPALIWAATPFELVAPSENRVLAVNVWAAEVEALLPVEVDFADLPPAAILSLDPTARLADCFRGQGLPLCVVRGGEQVARPEEHVLYPLAGDLAARSGLVLTREEVRDLGRDDVKRRWQLEPWLDAARVAGTVVLLGAEPAQAAFRAWWEGLLQSGLAGVDVLAVGDAAAGWPAGITAVAADWAELWGTIGRRDPFKEEAMEFANGYALIVGVGADLPVTVTDAQGVCELLTDPSRCAYPTSHVKLLTEAKADRTAVLTALDELATQVADTPDATAVIYFSGHGRRVETAEGKSYYLMTHGYNLHDLPGTTISGDVLTAMLAALEVQKLVVLLDCCHAGGFERTKAPGMTLEKAPMPMDVERVLAAGGGRVILASSKADEVSRIGTPYSVFTKALLEGLAGAGAVRHDGYAGILDVFNYVTTVVPERTKDKRPPQHPVMQSNNLDGNFALAYYAAGAKSPRPLSWMNFPPTPPPTPLPSPRPLSRDQRRRLETKRNELSDRFDTLSRRISALDNDIDRARTSLDRQVFQEEKAERVAERDEVERKLGEIDAQLEGGAEDTST